jgi:hypothetical protein
LDGDGDLDVLIAGELGYRRGAYLGYGVFEGVGWGWVENRDGLGDFGPLVVVTNAVPEAVAFLGNANGDGRPDVLVCGRGVGPAVWFLASDATAPPSPASPTPPSPASPTPPGWTRPPGGPQPAPSPPLVGIGTYAPSSSPSGPGSSSSVVEAARTAAIVSLVVPFACYLLGCVAVQVRSGLRERYRILHRGVHATSKAAPPPCGDDVKFTLPPRCTTRARS